MTEQSTFLTVREAADYWRVSPRFIRVAIESGKLSSRRLGRVIRIRRDDLESLFAPTSGIGGAA